MSSTRRTSHEHDWQYRDIEGETWNVCWDCGFRELWADGMLVDSSDWVESGRLNLEAVAE